MLLALAMVAVMQTITHEFVYVADQPRKSVSVAGSFNNWDRNANPMRADADGRTWRTKVGLGVGQHQYKFVLDGDQWIVDPKSKDNRDDGNGNINSFLTLLPSDYSAPAVRGDGSITLSGLQHDATDTAVYWDRGHLTLQFRTRKDDVERVSVRVGTLSTPMSRTSSDDLYDYYRARVKWDGKSDLEYVFNVQDRRTFSYGSKGLDGGTFRISAKDFKPFAIPTWAEGAVFYQIFPERFENGDPANDPANSIAWGGKPEWFNFMGGDLAGIRKRAGHIVDLGVQGIYLNPIFEGPSNHGYETTDYLKVAKRMGTNDDLRALVRELKPKGVRVVLDGVFNHTATDFFAFTDLRERGEESKFRDWFFPRSFPIKVGDPPNYEAWFGFPSMPKVNLRNAEARKYMLDVTHFWHREAGIDGWRLDVANEVEMDFWREFRKTVKGLSPEQWIVGEVWGDARQWLRGDQWDSAMGYQFRDAALKFIAEGNTTATQFIDALLRVYESYPPQVSRNLMNLLSSHDTPRFLTLCKGDRELALLGATVQMTWPGSPSIYYGEELGMEGAADPDNRRGMEWNRLSEDNPFLKHYRRLMNLRSRSAALRTGEPIRLLADDARRTVAYGRVEGSDVALVAVNRSDQSQTISIPLDRLSHLKLPGAFEDALAGATVRRSGAQLVVTLTPRSAAVLLPASRGTARSVRDASRASAPNNFTRNASLRRHP
jgi:glycosidase